nr:DegQ family serine endoprotease [Mesorhizobium australicum]
MNTRLLITTLALCTSLAAGPTLAQENGSIRDLFGNMLRGTESAQPGVVDKRVPFGREEMQLSFAPLVKQTAPAVVNVYASQVVRQNSPFMGDPFFERFFGGGGLPPREQSSLGSGVIVDKSGIVVTNYHVIRDADEVKVALSDGREFESTVILKDERVDLAVLRITSDQPFPTIPIGDSDALEVGDLVLAMGNPFGVGQTTTSGIVSALARNRVGISDFGFFIQTDAAINPGNSGGALLDMSGRLIGINTAIYSRGGGSNGIGFAIPSNMVRAVVNAAENGSDVFERPYVGAGFEAVTPQVAEALGLPRPSGALISSVDEDSPASRAGLKPGDVVLAMNGSAIEHVDALGYRLAVQNIDAEIALTVLRQGKETEVKVKLERAPEGKSNREITIDGNSPFGGAKVTDLSPRSADRLGLPTNLRGVVIVETPRNSTAERVGLQPRDIIRAVNGRQIDTAEQMQVAASQETRLWRFTIERDGRLMTQVLRY